MNVSGLFEELEWRGFIKQCTDPDKLRRALAEEKLTAYIGFDPTADSLHVGSLLPLMSLHHAQKFGHKPIVLAGGATALVGDPSGKTDMRKMLSVEEIRRNIEGFRPQFERFVDFSAGAMLVNNADWGVKLNYIEFLRDVGTHFRVNVMLNAECFKSRLDREEGLSFLEFNYMLLQAYDFMVLARDHGCRLQMGGDDQWSNILAGIDLTRRMLKKEVFGLTFPLLETASGAKMGKTEKGAVWMDAARTSPYDFYQYWRNTEDADVVKFLKLFTLLDKKEIDELSQLKDREINEAKKRLAFEVTRLVHGEDEAKKSRDAAQSLFEGADKDTGAVDAARIPLARLNSGISVLDLFVECGLAASKGEARRLIRQGGAYLNDEPVAAEDRIVNSADLREGVIMLRAGKKKYRRVEAE